jgi:hypothetical protein
MTSPPSDPPTSEPTRSVGYWRDPHDSSTADLPEPQTCVDDAWDPRERAMVARYLRRGDTFRAYPGETWCRFRCGIDDAYMGTRDLTDGEWIWPEGFPHYVEKHGVRPPDEFVEHVRRRVAAGAGEGPLRRLARRLGLTGARS